MAGIIFESNNLNIFYFQYLGAMKWYWLSLGYFASNMHIAHCKCVSDTHTQTHKVEDRKRERERGSE